MRRPLAADRRVCGGQPKTERGRMSLNQGGCLCGAIRYATSSRPLRVTFCHCKFCQRATGSAYMVEPIFQKSSFEIISGIPATYTQASEGSGKRVTINFCSTCGTKLFLAFERFPEIFGVYGGTFDDPNWFERLPAMSRHIFLASAQNGTVIPAGIGAYFEHAILNDGTPVEPTIFGTTPYHRSANLSTGRASRGPRSHVRTL
jgi:hypothetical protein